MSFIAETSSGHTVTMDGAPEAGGRNLAPRSMELVLAGLGGCSSFDIVKLLRDAKQKVSAVELRLEASRADSAPAVFTHIKGHFIVSGRNIEETEVAKAVSVSATQLSSVAKMLEKSAVMEWDYEIINDE